MNKKRGLFTINSTTCTHESRRAQVYVDDTTHPVGGNSKRERINLPDGITVLPIDENNTVTLIECFVYGRGERVLKAISGTIDLGKTPLQIVHQELKEEAGIVSGNVFPLGETHTLGGRLYHNEHLFIATDLEYTSQELGDFENDIKVIPMTLQEAFEKVRSNQITEPNSCILIYEAWIRKQQGEL